MARNPVAHQDWIDHDSSIAAHQRAAAQKTIKVRTEGTGFLIYSYSSLRCVLAITVFKQPQVEVCRRKLDVCLRCFETKNKRPLVRNDDTSPQKAYIYCQQKQSENVIAFEQERARASYSPLWYQQWDCTPDSMDIKGFQKYLKCRELQTQDERHREAIVAPHKCKPRPPLIAATLATTARRYLLGGTLPQNVRLSIARAVMRSRASPSHSFHRLQREGNM